MAENQNNRMKVIHYHSLNGAAPKPENLEIGEIALSNKAGEEKLFVKNTDEEIVSSKLGDVTTKDIISAEAIEYSGETIFESGVTLDEILSETIEQIIDNEKINARAYSILENKIGTDITAAINELDSSVSGESSTGEIKVTVKEENGKLTKIIVDSDIRQQELISENVLISKDIEYSGETLVESGATLNDTLDAVMKVIHDDELVTSAAINKLGKDVKALESASGASAAISALTEELKELNEKVSGITEDLEELNEKVSGITEDLEELDEVTSTAMNILNEKISGLTNDIDVLAEVTSAGMNILNLKISGCPTIDVVTELISGYTPDVTSIVGSGFSADYTVEQALNDTEEIFAAAANDLNKRIMILSGDVAEIKDELADIDMSGAVASAKTYTDEVAVVLSGNIVELKEEVLENEEVTAGAIAYLNKKIADLESGSATSAETEILNTKVETFSASTVAEFASVRAEIAGLDAVVSGESSTGEIKVTVKEENGKLTEVIVDSDIKQQDLYAKNVLFTHDITVSGETIVSSGETVDNFAENILSEVLDNEVVTSNALNNLNDRVAKASADTVAVESKVDTLSASTILEIARVEGLIDTLESGSVKDVKYDSATKYIYIEKEDGTKTTGFDASVFVKDGMLSGVTYDGSAHTMTFIWNTDSGHEAVTIDLDDIIAPYNGDSKTVKIEDNVVSAIVDTANGVVSYDSYAEFSAKTTEDIADVKADVAELSGETIAFSAATVEELAAIRKDLTSNNVLVNEDITYSGVTIVASGASVTDALRNQFIEMIDNEETISKALTDLDERVDALEGDGKVAALSAGTMAELAAVRAEAAASAATLDAKIDSSINALDAVVSGQSVTGEIKVTVKEENGKLTEVVVDSEIKQQDLISDKVLMNKDVTVSGETLTESGDTLTEAMENTLTEILKNERVTATALNNLNDRIVNLSGATYVSIDAISTDVESLKDNPTQYLTVDSGVTIENGVIKVDENWINEKVEAMIEEINGGTY